MWLERGEWCDLEGLKWTSTGLSVLNRIPFVALSRLLKLYDWFLGCSSFRYLPSEYITKQKPNIVLTQVYLPASLANVVPLGVWPASWWLVHAAGAGRLELIWTLNLLGSSRVAWTSVSSSSKLWVPHIHDPTTSGNQSPPGHSVFHP